MHFILMLVLMTAPAGAIDRDDSRRAPHSNPSPEISRVDVERALALVFPNFSTAPYRRYDDGLVRWLMIRFERLNPRQRRSLLNTITNSRVGHDLELGASGGEYDPNDRTVGMTTTISKIDRVTYVHELQHAVDHLERPHLYDDDSYMLTLRREWRALGAELEYIAMSLTTDQITYEIEVAETIAAELVGQAGHLSPTFVFKGQDFVEFDEALASESELASITHYGSALMMGQLLRRILTWSRFRQKLSMLRPYLKEIAVEFFAHPRTYVVGCSALLTGSLILR